MSSSRRPPPPPSSSTADFGPRSTSVNPAQDAASTGGASIFERRRSSVQFARSNSSSVVAGTPELETTRPKGLPWQQQNGGGTPASGRAPAPRALVHSVSFESLGSVGGGMNGGTNVVNGNGKSGINGSAVVSNGVGTGTASKGGGNFDCPICGEPCITLSQLNRHLDDNHQEEDDIGDRILGWFRKTQRSAAKAIQSTTLKAQATLSFDRLDKAILGGGYELNNDSPASGSTTGAIPSPLPTPSPLQNGVNAVNNLFTTLTAGGSSSSSSSSSSFVQPQLPSDDQHGPPPLTEDAVTRRHWQRGNGLGDVCSIAGCGKTLSPPLNKVVGALAGGAGRQNCRRCGKLCCEAHTSFQMRLGAEDARHEPVAGIWCRVCEACYVGRDGYADGHGVSRRRTSTFLKMRKGRVDQVHLEVNKLEKRLEKVEIDQSVVQWEDDNAVPRCPLCSVTFSTLGSRRHHCRLCGIVVCGSERTGCSTLVPLPPQPLDAQSSLNSPLTPTGSGGGGGSNAGGSSYNGSESGGVELVSPGEVRVCRTCKGMVNRRLEAVSAGMAGSNTVPVMIKLYGAIGRYKGVVEETLPKFNQLIAEMGGREVSFEDRAYVMASRHRKNLLDCFAEIERLGKRIKSLPVSNPASQQQRLQDAVHTSTIQYLQANMYTLHMMPKTLQEAQAERRASVGQGSIATLTLEESDRLAAAEVALDAMRAQETQLRGLVEEATRRRRLEDLGSLKEALGEVVMEVDALKREVEELKAKGVAVRTLPGGRGSRASSLKAQAPPKKSSPTARGALFQIDGVKSVLLRPDFITVLKDEDAARQMMELGVCASIMDFFATEKDVLADEVVADGTTRRMGRRWMILRTFQPTRRDCRDDQEVVGHEDQADDTGDGGTSSSSRGFEDEDVRLKLKGHVGPSESSVVTLLASSVVTLKNGIENMLSTIFRKCRESRMLDEADEVSEEEFQNLEDMFWVKQERVSV
ncbi:carboxypeptidase Y-deficient [Irineochytrium annulatum]|nr:carboxypeptidase Y-deficient [Irineochytrium annulatum]